MPLVGSTLFVPVDEWEDPIAHIWGCVTADETTDFIDWKPHEYCTGESLLEKWYFDVSEKSLN